MHQHIVCRELAISLSVYYTCEQLTREPFQKEWRMRCTPIFKKFKSLSRNPDIITWQRSKIAITILITLLGNLYTETKWIFQVMQWICPIGRNRTRISPYLRKHINHQANIVGVRTPKIICCHRKGGFMWPIYYAEISSTPCRLALKC